MSCRPHALRFRHSNHRVLSKPFEILEGRQLLSSTGLNKPVATLDWQGHSAKAVEGEYVLALNANARLVAGRGGDWQVAALQRALDGKAGAGGFKVSEYLGQAGEFLLDVPLTTPYAQVLAAAQCVKGFEYVEPNFVFQMQATPNDPLYSYQYGLNNTGTTPLGASKAGADIGAAQAWDVTTGSSDVVVGLVDSGVDYTHPDLAANMWHNPGEIPGDGIDNDRDGYIDDVYGINATAPAGSIAAGDPMDDNGHGTHTAGTIAAVGDNGIGTTGVAWNAKIMALKFLSSDGSGAIADAVECLNYAVMMRNRGVNIRLTSNSWGGGGFEQSLKNAIAATNNAGMLFVVAAGNGGDDGIGDNNDLVPDYPSNYDLPNVISVAATDRYDQLADFSNYGLTTVDLAAPGVDIASTALGGGYVYMSGTSMATPHVSGVAALAFSAKPDATAAQVRTAILAGVTPLSNLRGKVATGGRLNAIGTLRALGAVGDGDDQIAEALPATVGATVSGIIGDAGLGVADVDTFAFNVVAGQRVAFDVNSAAGVTLDSYLRVFDATGNQLAANDDGAAPDEAAGTDSYLEYTFPTAGTYYFSVSAASNIAYSAVTGTGDVAGSLLASAAGGTGAYSVALTNSTVGNDANDQLGEAMAVPLGSLISGGSLVTAKDVDMYAFTVAAGERVAFDIDRPADGTLDSYLRVFDANGKQLGYNDNGAAPGEAPSNSSYLEVTFPVAGTYFVGVSAAPNRSYNPVTGGPDVSGRSGDYSLAITDVAAAPAPPAIAAAADLDTPVAVRTAASRRGLFSDVSVAQTVL